MNNHTPGQWYATNTSAGQGLICSENTGETIAVCYDQKNALILAAAPELLHWLKKCEHTLSSRQLGHGDRLTDGEQWLLGNVRTALRSAERN